MLEMISSLCYVAAMYILFLLPSSLSPLHGLGFYIFSIMFGTGLLLKIGAINGFVLVCVMLVANSIAATIVSLMRLAHRLNYKEQTRPPFPWYFHRVLRGQLILTLMPLLFMCYYMFGWKCQSALSLSDIMTFYVPNKKLTAVFVFMWYMNLQSGLYGVLYMLGERTDKPGWYAGALFGSPVYTDYVVKIVFLNHFFLALYLHLFCMFPM